jgi:Asp-tRNA(Asn)/Glu-tRNA(Gln) amidotransferase B subunit
VRKQLPELPDSMKKRLCDEYKLNEYDAEVIVNEGAVSFFENVVKGGNQRDPIACAHWSVYSTQDIIELHYLFEWSNVMN